MDYTEWGKNYLDEANALKERIAPLKRELKTAEREAAPLLFRRIVLLEEMYLDCLHTGKYLIKRAKI